MRRGRFQGLVVCALLGAMSVAAEGIYQIDLPDANLESSLNAVVARRLGLNEPYRVTVDAERLAKSMNSVRKAIFEDDARKVAVVIKNYRGGDDKWRKRFQREMEMNAAYRAAGLKTLDVVVAVPNQGIAVTRFLEDGVAGGKLVASAEQNDSESLGLMERLGADLAVAHRDNLCMRDLKPDNVMSSRGDIVFIDLDLATHCGGRVLNAVRAWDIAWFSYSAAMAVPGGPERVVIDAFVKGYLGNGGSSRAVREAAKVRYAVVARLMDKHAKRFMAANPDVFERVRSEIEAAAR